MSVLSSEISPNQYPAAASTQYRKNLALNLFYKVGETVTLNNDAQVSCSFILQSLETVLVIGSDLQLSRSYDQSLVASTHTVQTRASIISNNQCLNYQLSIRYASTALYHTDTLCIDRRQVKHSILPIYQHNQQS